MSGSRISLGTALKYLAGFIGGLLRAIPSAIAGRLRGRS